MDNKKKTKIENQLLGYFRQQVLSSYRDEPDKYIVKTDYFSGEVTVTDSYYKKLEKQKKTDNYIKVRFGYRALQDGELAIMAFLPDLFKDSPAHIKQWSGFLINKPLWSAKQDKRFNMWKEVYLEGSWKHGDSLITRKIYEVCSYINGIALEVTGKQIYKYGNLDEIKFPSAQNTHRYEDAFAELNRYFRDGIDSNTLIALSEKLNQKLVLNPGEKEKTIFMLKKVFPELELSKNFNSFFTTLRKQRVSSTHGIRKQALPFRAFEKFSKDLELLYKGLKEFLRILERKFKIKGKMAFNRNEAKKWLPIIVKAPEPHYSINKAKFMIGKKVANVETGQRKSIKGVHESEAMILTFTDGSILGIETGSNAKNIELDTSFRKRKKIKAEDFHSDFHLTWVPRK